MGPHQAGDASSLFDKYYDRIFRAVRKVVKDSAESEDLTQEAFLRTHRWHETLKDPGAMLTWLYHLVNHASLDRRRRPKGLKDNQEAGIL